LTKKSYYKRKSPRLEGYDYSQSGGYFITICTHNREHLFGEIEDDIFILSSAGQIAQSRWIAMPEHHPHVILDEFIIMPNHVHLIVFLDNDEVQHSSLSRVIASYKSSVTRCIRQALGQGELKIWQSRFHDHIIRNEAELNTLRNYVIHNVELWAEDKFILNRKVYLIKIFRTEQALSLHGW